MSGFEETKTPSHFYCQSGLCTTVYPLGFVVENLNMYAQRYNRHMPKICFQDLKNSANLSLVIVNLGGQ